MQSPPTVNGRAVLLIGAVALCAGLAVTWLLADRAPTPGRVTSGTASDRPISASDPGSAIATPTPATTTVSVDPQPLGPLDARLVATVVRPEPADSFAAISRSDGSGTALLGVGETLAFDERARVFGIGDGWTDIDHAGTVIRLTTSSRLDPLAEEFLEAVRGAPRRAPSPAERARREALAERLRALMGAASGSGNRVRGTGAFAEGRTTGHWDGDRLTSIEIDEIEPGGLFDEIGFENGDRVASINGVPVGDSDAAARILMEMVTADEIVARVERADGPGEITIPADDLLEELRRRFSELAPEDLEALEDLQLDLPPEIEPSLRSP